MTADPRTEDLLMDLAQLGMGVARRLHDVVLATDDPDRVAALGIAYHQVSRGIRQSLALKARFAAGAPPVQRAPASPSPQATPPATPAAPRPERTGWNEHERPDSDELLDALDRLADAAEDEPVDLAHAERVIAAGLARLRGETARLTLPGRRGPAAASRAMLMGAAATRRVMDSS